MSKFSSYTLLNDIAAAMFSACATDLPDVEYHQFTPAMRREGKLPQEGPLKKRRPSQYDLDDVIVFTQMWGSTALGFGGMGGAAMTTAPTIIFRLRESYAVYFGGRFAYLVNNPNGRFWSDVSERNMVDVSRAKTRYSKEDVT